MLVSSLKGCFKIDRWTTAAVFTAAVLISSVLSLSYGLPELDYRLALLLIGLVFIGMPHGAMDIYLLLKSLGRGRRLVIGLAAYVAIATPIVLIWQIYPTACFLFFIGYSMFHFADSDIQKVTSGKFVEFIARWSLPFCVPFVFHRSETLKLVHWIHPRIDLTRFEFLIYGFAYIGLIFVDYHTVKGLIRFVSNFPNQDMSFLEPIVLSVLFIFISPLYSLAIYFCFVHSIKHLINVVTRVEIRSLASILPFWLVPLVGLPLISILYIQNMEQLESGLFQYSLIVLSALALPHALLVRYSKQTGMLA